MNNTPDFTWLFIKMVFGLSLVIGLVFVLFKFVLPKTRLLRSRDKRWAHLLDQVRLDQSRSLYLVKIIERYFVLGAAENSLQVITEITPSEWEKVASQDRGK